MKLIVESSILSATIATALLVWPTSSSPIINPLVVVDSVTIEDRVARGAEAAEVSDDSNIPWTDITSGTFNEIILSSTLVPYG